MNIAKKICKTAFTLSEALLVMVILGVIATILVRSLKIVDASQKGYDTKAEKAVSIIGQTFIMMLLQDSSTDDLTRLSDNNGGYSIEDADVAERFSKAFKRHLEVNALSPDLGSDYFNGELYNYKKESLGDLSTLYSNFFFTQDGMLFGFRYYGNCTSSEANSSPPYAKSTTTINDICGSIFVDVNGIKKPNKLGSDQIIIPFDKNGTKLTNE